MIARLIGVLGVLLIGDAAGQTFEKLDTGSRGDAMIQGFLDGQASRLHETYMDGIQSKEDWLRQRPAFEEEYLYMLGLSPMPEKNAVRSDRDRYAGRRWLRG
jgi:hypothetical protein|tara:strand:- start:924 stop:1229 length:306 start_codon:yes stop_codon:yes gene_type:complete